MSKELSPHATLLAAALALGGIDVSYAEEDAAARTLTSPIPQPRPSDRKLIRTVVELAATACPAPQAAYLDGITIGPVRSRVEEVAEVTFRCLDSDDPRLGERGRNAVRRDAGQGFINAAPKLVAPFGWDLSYRTVFDAGNVSRADTVRKFFYDTSQGAEYLRGQRLDPAVVQDIDGAQAAYLVDVQSNYFGIRAAIMAFANTSEATSRTWNAKGRSVHTVAADPATVQRIAKELMQFTPAPAAHAPRDVEGTFVYSGYVGAVSVWVDGERRQFLVTAEDLYPTRDSTKDPALARLLGLTEQ